VRAAGVSNFNVNLLGDLLGIARIRPAVVQAYSDPLRQVGGAGGWWKKEGR
jgi:diketogulonate reductase-like aldo/keto reductase